VSGNAPEIPIVAVDAMGGDHGPSVVVPGAVEALRGETGFQLALYGDGDAVESALRAADAADLSVEVIHCSQDIEMGESPAAAIRAKPDSPIARAMKDHREGRVHAVVSAGSTGAMVAASLLMLGRLPGVDRPAIGTVIPTYDSRFLLLDAGANVQSTPQHLLAFAAMGSVYCHEILEIPTPRVGLLNIGEEPGKGSDLTVAANSLLQDSGLNFIGNIEGRSLLFDAADIVVTDGFTGNIVLKMIEGFGGFLQQAASRTVAGGGNRLQDLLTRMDYASTGGALLLGVAGSIIISHGSSSSRAIANAVRMARRLADCAMPDRIAAALAEQR